MLSGNVFRITALKNSPILGSGVCVVFALLLIDCHINRTVNDDRGCASRVRFRHYKR